MLKALPGAQRTAVRALLGLLLVGGLVFLAATLLRRSQELSPLLDGWLVNGVYLLSGVLCLVRAVLVRRERVAWICMGAGLELFMLGNVFWFFVVRTQNPQPYPSLADALYLGFYPLAFVAIALLARQRIRRFHTTVWLDGIVAGLGSAAICAAIAFQTIVDATGGTLAAVATNLTYPVGDLLLLVLVMGAFALLGWQPDGMWRLLGVGLILFAAGDTAYLFRVAADTYQLGTPLDGPWARPRWRLPPGRCPPMIGRQPGPAGRNWPRRRRSRLPRSGCWCWAVFAPSRCWWLVLPPGRR